jgi:hypothetical protein
MNTPSEDGQLEGPWPRVRRWAKNGLKLAVGSVLAGTAGAFAREPAIQFWHWAAQFPWPWT